MPALSRRNCQCYLSRKRKRRREVVEILDTDDGDLAVDRDDYRVVYKLLSELLDGMVEIEIEKEVPKIIEMQESDTERRVRKLTLQYNFDGIPTLPKSLTRLTNLTHLDLQGSNITSLPWLGTLKKLEHLGLSSTEKLFELPEAIGNLVGLNKLDLSWSSIMSLPSSIGRLRNLKYLDLTYAKFELPDTIGDLDGLTILKMSESKLKSLPPSIGRLQNLEELDLSKTAELLELPEAIGNLAGLHKLDLEWSKINSLPSSIGRLKNLKHLDLSYTFNLLELPVSIGDLLGLEKWDMVHSQIRSLPPSIGRLRNLSHLNISHCNGLLKLSESIGDLVGLKRLAIRCGKIGTLPASIGKLTNLEVLDLYDVKHLMKVPVEIGGMTRLTVLNLRRSRIEVLPDSIGTLRDLRYLNVKDAPLSDLRETDLLRLVGRCRSLGFLCCDPSWRSEKLEHRLARNRARFRNLPTAPKDRAADRPVAAMALTPTAPPGLWPLLLANADRAFRDADPRIDPFHPHRPAEEKHGPLASSCEWDFSVPDRHRIRKQDAVYELLADARGSFLGVLANRDRSPPERAVATRPIPIFLRRPGVTPPG